MCGALRSRSRDMCITQVLQCWFDKWSVFVSVTYGLLFWPISSKRCLLKNIDFWFISKRFRRLWRQKVPLTRNIFLLYIYVVHSVDYVTLRIFKISRTPLISILFMCGALPSRSRVTCITHATCIKISLPSHSTQTFISLHFMIPGGSRGSSSSCKEKSRVVCRVARSDSRLLIHPLFWSSKIPKSHA